VVAVTNTNPGQACAGYRVPEACRRSRFAEPALRNNNRAVLVPAFEAILRTQPAAHWLAVFDAAGIPAEPINTLPEILDHPAGRRSRHAHRSRISGRLRQPYPHRRHAWRAVAAEGPVLSPPGLGQHTEEVLSELHLRSSRADDEDRLRADVDD